LHEDTLLYQDRKREKIIGSVHLKIAKIASVAKDPLLININNGTNEITLRTVSIKEKVDWINALVKAQQMCME